MSTLTRYRTVVHNLARIYSAGDAERTSILKTGLEEILAGIGPLTPAQWELVRHDSKCLLRVWAAREKNEVADTMMEQLLGMMEELVTATATTTVPVEPPKGLTPPATVLRVPVAETIHHVTPMLIPAAATVSPKVVVPLPPAAEEKTVTLIVEELAPASEEEVEVEIEEEEEEVVEETVEEEVEVEEEVVKEEVVEETVEEEVEVEEEVVKEEVVEGTVEEEEEVVEEVLEPAVEEEAEEEEAGMEVEQVFIRGRAYWLETNTQKLYAIVDEEDVGDEVGAMVNGKPQFLAAAK